MSHSALLEDRRETCSPVKMITGIPAMALIALAMPAAIAAAAEPRPNIFGCGMVWGNWLGLTGENAREWDRRSMDKIVEMGGTNCPANFAWIDIERVRGQRNWAYVDHQVNEARARGLEVFAYSGLTPDWALPSGILQQYGSGIGYRFPPDPQYIPDFEDFFRTLAARYRGKVKYYEFWNEPNGCSWINDGCANGHMAYTYVPWLKRWYTAMKQGDPDCVLAVGGLDYHSGVTNGYQYIADIYANGGGDSFDAVAIHPYGNPLNWKAITDTYNVLVQHGHGHKKLWLNEYGWDTSNETDKAAKLTTVLTELKKPQYDMVFQANYLIITDLPGTPNSGHDYGLCSRNVSTLTITPRASWIAFRDFDKSFGETVDFTADKTSGNAPLTVQFTDKSSVAAVSARLWEFGDGQTSTQTNPQHTYQQVGTYTVRLTVTGTAGSKSHEKADYIRVSLPPVMTSVRNPSFEDNGGSLDQWEIVILSTTGPDNPPRNNSNPYGLVTAFGTHFGGKISSGSLKNFYMGQVIETLNFHPLSSRIDWQLDTWVQMYCSFQNQPKPDGIHMVWEIGWNDNGSVPANIMSCQKYAQMAAIDGTYTNNHATNFLPLVRSGSVTGVTHPRAVVLRVHIFNDGAWWWSYFNFDNVIFEAVAVPPAIPGDFDGDGDVDLDDFGSFQSCASGPALPHDGSPLCRKVDIDNDNDVDQSDFAIFQRCLSGPDMPADPGCAGG